MCLFLFACIIYNMSIIMPCVAGTLLVFTAEMSLASQSMYRAVKEAYEPEWVGYTELTSAVEVFICLLCIYLC